MPRIPEVYQALEANAEKEKAITPTDSERGAAMVQLGQAIRAKNPGLSSYEAVKKALEVMLNHNGSPDLTIHAKHGPEAVNFLNANHGASGVAKYLGKPEGDFYYDESIAKKYAPAYGVRPEQMDDYQAGLMGHELLGHGVDAAIHPESDEDARSGKAGHWARNADRSTGNNDWLINELETSYSTNPYDHIHKNRLHKNRLLIK